MFKFANKAGVFCLLLNKNILSTPYFAYSHPQGESNPSILTRLHFIKNVLHGLNLDFLSNLKGHIYSNLIAKFDEYY